MHFLFKLKTSWVTNDRQRWYSRNSIRLKTLDKLKALHCSNCQFCYFRKYCNGVSMGPSYAPCAYVPKALKVEIWSFWSKTKKKQWISRRITNEKEMLMFWWRRDTQHNDTQHNDTQHNDSQHNNMHNDTQYNDMHHNETLHSDTLSMTLSIMTLSVWHSA